MQKLKIKISQNVCNLYKDLQLLYSCNRISTFQVGEHPNIKNILFYKHLQSIFSTSQIFPTTFLSQFYFHIKFH